MDRDLSRRAAIAVLGAVSVGISARPAAACTVGWPFQAGKPFGDSYFDDGHTVFRGIAVAYNRLRHAAAVTFTVKETYRGETRDSWIAVWQNSTFGHPRNLTDFKQEVGDDLVVVLRASGEKFDPQPILPMIVQRPCHEPAMQAFEVMEPLLRERGLLN